MAKPLDAGVRIALNRPRVLGVVGLAVGFEAALRFALLFAHPVLAVVVPPVFAVVILGSALPEVRNAVEDPGARIRLGRKTVPSAEWQRLVAVSVVGHAAALAVGASCVLLIDTPIRYALYATGGGPVSTLAMYATPLIAVAFGTLVSWGLFGPAVVGAVDDDGPLSPVGTALGAAIADRRRTGLLLAIQAVAAVAIGTAFFGGVLLARGANSVTPALVLAGVISLPVATVVTLFCYPIQTALLAGGPTRRDIPVRTVALAGLAVTGLVVGASAVRLTETRPMAEAEPLPDDPTGAYAAALENTVAGDHRVEYRTGVGPGNDTDRLERTVDRSDRQFLVDRPIGDTQTGYASSGLGTGGYGHRRGAFELGERSVDGTHARAVPYYFDVAEDYRIDDGPGVPSAGTGEWQTVERSEETLTVELTDGDAVASALVDREFEDYQRARIRMRIDEDGGVLTGGAARLNASDGDRGVDLRTRYAIRAGPEVDARRPAALGSPLPGEVVWRLFAY